MYEKVYCAKFKDCEFDITFLRFLRLNSFKVLSFTEDNEKIYRHRVLCTRQPILLVVETRNFERIQNEYNIVKTIFDPKTETLKI